jgi:DNA-binding CsgD family transcriptional regulator
MTDADAESRQRRQDREYLEACRAAGIKPEAPRYMAHNQAEELEAIDRFAIEQDGAHKNGHGFQVTRAEPEPLKELPPEAEAVSRTLDLLCPHKADAPTFVKTAGRRCLALSWLLGKRPEPLAELARQLGCSRAALSSYVRGLEDRTGLHGRGQKAVGARGIYRSSAHKSWKLRRLNKAFADAVAE